MLQSLCLRGKVFSGEGEGTKFIKLQWVKNQIKEKLGFTPYPGTLNIRLSQDNVKLKKGLTDAKGIEIWPTAGFRRGKLLKAYLMGNVECAVVVPEVAGYPEDIIEIIAPTNLREKLHLADGDIVDFKIMI